MFPPVLTTVLYAMLPLALALVGLGFLLGRKRSAGIEIASASDTHPLAERVDTVLDVIGEGVLLANSHGELSYLNGAARRALALDDFALPAPVEALLSEYPPLVQLLRGGDASADAQRNPHELEVGAEDSRRSYAMRLVELQGPQGEPAGRMVVLGVAVDVTERIRAEEQIRALAFYDTLTGLPNRRRFQRLLGRSLDTARRQETRVALLFVDLDRFKEVNDLHGRSSGDHLLRDVAERLRESVRATDELACADAQSATHADTPGDTSEGTASVDASKDGAGETVARLAGDEFTVVLPDVGDAANAAQVACRIIESMSRPFRVGSHEVFITASVGIAMYPDDGVGTDALQRCAGQAMQDAKRRGPNGYAFFDAAMHEVHARRVEIQTHLRHAIEKRELRVVYQQIRSATSGRICGSEALVRWDSAELGAVEPTEFIPIAERSGMIVDIGRWVLREACRQQAEWRAKGLLPPRVAINVSAAQLQLAEFAEDARAIIQAAGLSPDEIEFELTETAILRQDKQTDVTLRALAEMGVRLSLDDFGTGQSSLSYLRRFAFSRIKIDRSFVAEIPGNRDDASITQAIIAMAHGLNLSVVAEGVEDEEQLEFLRNHGCDELQGFLFARPETASQFGAHLERTKPERDES